MDQNSWQMSRMSSDPHAPISRQILRKPYKVVNETLPGTNFLTGVRKISYENLRPGVNLGRRIFVGRNISAAVIDSLHLQLSEMKAFCFNCQNSGHLAYTCRKCKEAGHNTWNRQDTAIRHSASYQ